MKIVYLSAGLVAGLSIGAVFGARWMNGIWLDSVTKTKAR